MSGNILPVAVEQVVKGGLSVLRAEASDVEFVSSYAAMKAASDARGKSRAFFGVSTFNAGEARRPDGSQVIGVFATGLPDRPNHADVAAPKMSRREAERAKKHLHDLVNAGSQKAADFRAGRLVAQMPR